MAQNCLCPGRTFHLLAISVRGMNAAKAALKGTSNTRLVGRRSFTEIRGPKIFFHWNPVEWSPRKRVWPLHQAFGVVAVQAKYIFVRQSGDVLEGSLPSKGFQELEESILSLTA